MFNKLSSSTIICVILGLMVFYYYNKFQDSESEFLSLHKKFDQIYTENQKMKTRLKDFQYYKNDVSKTFKILDKELEQINEHIYNQHNTEENSTQQQTINQTINQTNANQHRTIRRTISTPIGPISTLYNLPISQLRQHITNPSVRQGTLSLITPDILTSLFSTMNTIPNNTPNNTQNNTPNNTQNNTPRQNTPTPREDTPREDTPREDTPREDTHREDTLENTPREDTPREDTQENNLENTPKEDTLENNLYDVNYLSYNDKFDQYLL